MTSIVRYPVLSAVACFGALTVSACGAGGDDAPADAPTDASRAEFCEAVLDTPEQLVTAGEEGAEVAREHADRLRDVGTPEDMPAAARAGWVAYVDLLANADDDSVAQMGEADSFIGLFQDDEIEDFGEFSSYIVDC